MASPRERAASMATARFSLIFFWPMNSARRCGRSFSSNEESSSTGAAETSRSRVSRLGLFFTLATGAIVPVLLKAWPLRFCLAVELGYVQQRDWTAEYAEGSQRALRKSWLQESGRPCGAASIYHNGDHLSFIVAVRLGTVHLRVGVGKTFVAGRAEQGFI